MHAVKLDTAEVHAVALAPVHQRFGRGPDSAVARPKGLRSLRTPRAVGGSSPSIESGDDVR